MAYPATSISAGSCREESLNEHLLASYRQAREIIQDW